jgi:hypothetical protein
VLDSGSQYTFPAGQMLLTDQLIQRLRPEPLGQRGPWSFHIKI